MVILMNSIHLRGLLVIIFIIAIGSCASFAGDTERPEYTVLLKNADDIEIREYAPMLVAETVVNDKSRSSAADHGFRILNDYISGNNLPDDIKEADIRPEERSRPPMPGEKIPMTTPVLQQQSENGWVISFVLPSKYTLSTAPQPNNPMVKLRQVPVTRVAVIKFSGLAGKGSIKSHTQKLKDFMVDNNIAAAGAPALARYSSHWTVPVARVNEIHIPVKY